MYVYIHIFIYTPIAIAIRLGPTLGADRFFAGMAAAASGNGPPKVVAAPEGPIGSSNYSAQEGTIDRAI